MTPKGVSATSSSDRFDKTQSEQEGFRLALMGDAVAVTASSVFFAVRLVDATFDLSVSSALYSGSIEASREAAGKYKTFLGFKASEELRSMAITLVLPLVVMRILGTAKDLFYSFGLQHGNIARKVLDIVDALILGFTAFFCYQVIPPLEAAVNALTVSDRIWEHRQLLEAFDEVEISHLIALALAGMLMLVSILKLHARLERSLVKNIERAHELESLENMLSERVLSKKEANIEKSAKSGGMERMDDTDSSESSSTQANAEQEEAVGIPSLVEIVSAAAHPIPGPQEVVTVVANTNHSHLETCGEAHESLVPRMDSDDFYRTRGWKRVPIPLVSNSNSNISVDASKEDSTTALDVVLGAIVGVATFVAVHKVHDPLVKLFRS